MDVINLELSNSCNMGSRVLPDMYAQSPGPVALEHTYQENPSSLPGTIGA